VEYHEAAPRGSAARGGSSAVTDGVQPQARMNIGHGSTALLLGLALALAGCPPTVHVLDASTDAPDGGDGSVCLANGASLTLGTGTDSTLATFRPLDDGANVYLVPGPQGGQHVWIGLRARGVDPAQPRVELRAFRASDDHLIGGLRVRFRMIETGEAGVWGLPGQTLIFDDDQYCSVLPGDVRITLDFTDGAGHCFHVERRVRVAGIDPLALEIDREARLRCCAQFLRRCYPDGGPAGADATADATADGG
jgi:hypothetical protein